jgi:hypothetical protein
VSLTAIRLILGERPQLISDVNDELARMPRWSQIIAVKCRLAILIGFLSAVVSAANDGETKQPSAQKSTHLVPLALKLPMRGIGCTTVSPIPVGPDIEPWALSRPEFMVPSGVTNIALMKKVTGSAKPFTGSLGLVTDGNKEPIDSSVTEIRKGVQWVQIDLEANYEIYAIDCWLDHRYIDLVYKGVIIAIADNPSFNQNVRVLFNNDKEGLAGLGVGTDKRYVETHLGKLVDAKGAKARYVRVYSNGSNLTQLNCFTEVEVWALPAKP